MDGRRITTVTVILIFLSAVALCPDKPADAEEYSTPATKNMPEEDLTEMTRLMTILEEHTDIATKSRLNADYVPGMVTVLYGEDLAAKGIHTVWQALRLAPGMDLPIENVGGRDILVRGVADNFFSGNTKLLLDGVSMNVLLYAEASLPIQIPIEQVDRIEVIRGPGSAIHGEFAYTSVVNIITRKDVNRVFGGIGRYRSFQGGGMIAWEDPERDLRLNFNAAAAGTDGADVETGPDILYGMGAGDLSNAPGPTNEGRDERFVFLTADWRDTSFRGSYLTSESGDAFGLTYALPIPEDRRRVESRQYTFELRHRWDSLTSLQAEAYVGWMEHDIAFKRMLFYPPGFAGVYPDGLIGGFYYEERRLSGGLDLTWKGWDRHTVLLGMSAADTDVGDMWVEANVVPSTLRPIPEIRKFVGDQNFLREDAGRSTHSVTLQDEFRINDAVTITAGLRYDHYDDVEDGVSPRLAAVWRVTDQHILKAQIARAFRPPTFAEMYSLNNPVLKGDISLGLSTIDTTEIGYVYKAAKTALRATTFYSVLSDMVTRGAGNSVSDDGEARIRGAELEIEHRIAAFLRFSGNISYVDAEDARTGNQMEGSANWLANAGLLYQPSEWMAFNLQYRYVGDRNRAADDPRNDLAASNTVDLTASFFHIPLRGLTLRAGVKNIFNENVRDPAPMARDPFAGSIPTYPDDFPRPGREWWATLSYEF